MWRKTVSLRTPLMFVPGGKADLAVGQPETSGGAPPTAIDHSQITSLRAMLEGPMNNIMFQCPRTGMNVPLSFPPDPSADRHAYESVPCPACKGLHLISKSDGKLLGGDK
jgi:hypothetical protein